MENVSMRLPTFYSQYLFYGDSEGINEWELAQLYNVLANHIPGVDLNNVTPLDSEEVGFCKWHYGSWADMPAADCADYTFPIPN
jgi:hypothetical protein